MDFETLIERTAAKLRVERLLELEELEQRLEAKRKRSIEISSTIKKVKVDHQKRREEPEITRHQAKELDQSLAAVRARDIELSQAIEAIRTEFSTLNEEAQLASAFMLSLEERRRKAILSMEEARAEAREHTHQDTLERIKVLEDQIWRMGNM